MDLSGREILVVDDVRFTRATLLKMLDQMGNPVLHEAASAEAALERLAEHRDAISCVITDLDMPGIGGLGLLRAIRSGTGSAPRDLKIVLLTGHSELEQIGPALLLDLDAFLSKPASKQALERCLARVLAAGSGVLAAPEIYRAVPIDIPASRNDPVIPQASSERRVGLAELPENAVLSRDLLFSNGRLLLRAGAGITPRMASRLHELAPVAGLKDEAWIVV